MNYFNKEQIKEASFPDTPILNFNIDNKLKILEFKSDVYVGTSPKGKWFDDCIVKLNKYRNLIITEEDSKVIEIYEDKYSLREICEFVFIRSYIIFRGFSSGPGLWTEFKFEEGELQIKFNQ